MLSYLLPGDTWHEVMSNPFLPVLLVLMGENALRTLAAVLIPQGLFSFFPKMAEKRFAGEAVRIQQTRTEVRQGLMSLIVMPIVGASLGYLAFHTGIYDIYETAGVSVLVSIGEFLLIVLLHDLYFYVTHWLMHRKRLFRWTHGMHHTSVVVQPLTAQNFAWPEAVLNALFIPLYLVLAGVIAGGMHYPPLVAFLFFTVAANVYEHSAVELAPTWWLRDPVTKYISTSTFHYLHHRRNRGNLGFYTTIWDRVFGTLDPEYEKAFERTASGHLLNSRHG